MIKQSPYHSIPSQSKRLAERHAGQSFEVDCCGMRITVEPGVYQTSGDSDLMSEPVQIKKEQTFLEVGCGTGVVSIAVAKRALSGVGVDINEKAVANSGRNAVAQGVRNLRFYVSNVFENVEGSFDVIICNPPYTKHEARDNIDRMFWDPDDEMKKKFFAEVDKFLKPDGKIYFGWADFADIDVELPLQLANDAGYRLVNTFKKSHEDIFNFYVFEFEKS